MRKDGLSAQAAHDLVKSRRATILPNEGFMRCLREYEKELSGARTGVYAPAPKAKPIDDEFELPPSWAAPPTHAGAKLVVEKHLVWSSCLFTSC